MMPGRVVFDADFADGLTKLFSEIREKSTVADLSPQYQKFAEWLRIEYVDAHVEISYIV